MSNDKRNLPSAANAATPANAATWGAILGGAAGATLAAAKLGPVPAPGDKAALRAWTAAVRGAITRHEAAEGVKRLDTADARRAEATSRAAAELNRLGVRPPEGASSYTYAGGKHKGAAAWQRHSLAAFLSVCDDITRA